MQSVRYKTRGELRRMEGGRHRMEGDGLRMNGVGVQIRHDPDQMSNHNLLI